MRLIDADALKAWFLRPYSNEETYSNLDICSKINSAPTIDAEEIVRCKDCKHLVSVNKNLIYAVCKKTNKVFYAFESYSSDTREFFCADGERKKMPTVNIQNIPESKIIKLVDLSDDSINKIAEAVTRNILSNTAEVVRCRDCKWWNDYEESCNGKFMRSDDYCSLGERKEVESAHWNVGFRDMTCSNCGTWFPNDRASYMRYCPYCQAKMENIK